MRAKKLADLRALEAERFVGELEQRVYAAEQRALQHEEIAAQLHQRTLQRDYVQTQLEQSRAELQHTLKDLTQLQDELRRSLHDRSLLGAELQHTLNDLAQLRAILEQMQQSASWRSTRPFRYLYKRYLQPVAATDVAIVPAELVPEPEPVLCAIPEPIIQSEPEPEPEPELGPQKPLLLVLSTTALTQAVASWPQWEVVYEVLPAAIKGSYIEVGAWVQQIHQKQPFTLALVYGADSKTALPALAQLGVASLVFADEKTARVSSRFTLQELFFGATGVVLENAAVLALCQAAYPQLQLERVWVLDPAAQANNDMQWQELATHISAYHEIDAADVQRLVQSPQFDLSFLDLKQPHGNSRQQLAYLYLRSWKTGIERRKPYAGFHPAIYAQQLEQNNQHDPFAHYLMQQQPVGPWNYPVITLPTDGLPVPACTQAVALHIHAYYPDMLAQILTCLNVNTLRPDLFISVKDAADLAVVKGLVAHYTGTVAALRVVPNVGRDIGPFLTEFGPQLVQNYALIGHVHTKKSLHVIEREAVDAWQSFLLYCLLGDGQQYAMADSIIAAMQADPQLGMVFPDDPKVLGWDRNRAFAQLLAPDLGLASLPTDFNFPAGNMFWLRAEVLARFVALDLQWDEYPLEPLGKDGTLLHAMERLFGVVPAAMGLTCAVSALSGVTR